jgi:hypothetical protein
MVPFHLAVDSFGAKCVFAKYLDQITHPTQMQGQLFDAITHHKYMQGQLFDVITHHKYMQGQLFDVITDPT